MKQKNFLLIVIMVSIFVGSYFFYVSQVSYRKYKVLNKKIDYLTEELQNIQIEKRKLEFQMASLVNDEKIDMNLLTQRNIIGKNELLVDIVLPVSKDGSWGVSRYIVYIILMFLLFIVFLFYYYRFPLFEKWNFSFFKKKYQKEDLLKEGIKEEQNNQSKKTKLFTLRMHR